MTQADTKRAIADYVNYRGQYAVVINVAGIPIKGDYTKLKKNPDMSGMKDVLICWYGVFIAVEVKRHVKEALRSNQEQHRARVLKANGIWWTVTGVDDFVERIEKHGKRDGSL